MYVTQDRLTRPLAVVCAISNPVRYKSRWKLFERFQRMVIDAGAVLVVVEAAFNEREHATTHCAPIGEVGSHAKAKPGTTHLHIKVRGKDELWLKENLQNIGASYVPEDIQDIAFMDADVEPVRPNWVGETLHQLQHYHVVQMFSEAQDLDPNYRPLKMHRSFMTCMEEGLPFPTGLNGTDSGSGGTCSSGSLGSINLWHPGFAWAFRRQALNDLGQLFEIAILGSGDRHMANALVGRGLDSVPAGMHPSYPDALSRWQDLADRYVERNVGCVKGLLLHYWHGRKADRGYRDRWQILVENQFNYQTDLKKNAQGVLHWALQRDARQQKLRDDVRAYFRSRNEDSIDVE